MNKIKLSLLFTVLSTSFAFAECLGMTQTELTECASIEFKQADADLNRVYQSLPKTSGLIAAEKAWIAYRDKQCHNEAKMYEGGSMYSMQLLSCLTEATEHQTQMLLDSKN